MDSPIERQISQLIYPIVLGGSGEKTVRPHRGRVCLLCGLCVHTGGWSQGMYASNEAETARVEILNRPFFTI